MTPILEIKNISKNFRIRHKQQPYLSLRDTVSNLFTKNGKTSNEEFWALKDVSFDVHPGESIGIIGKNGAGKSTLLKILSKITPPTEGKIISRGRIASLLEVGTGFHAELSGRENVFLNGSILGMKRKEILAKFDEIVDFSGVEKFLDTPLKHYSSGMQLRLAFAVAAFLEPEILLIDEVLAVGDAVFQQKCLRQMLDITRSGRTILFVSHQLSAVQQICSSGVLLTDGKIVFKGNSTEVVNYYVDAAVNKQDAVNILTFKRTIGKNELLFSSIDFNNNLKVNESLKICLKLKSVDKKKFTGVEFGIGIKDMHHNVLLHLSNKYLNIFTEHTDDSRIYFFETTINLRPGNYFLTFFLRANEEIQDWLVDYRTLTIIESNPYGYYDSSQIQGLLYPSYNFTCK